MDYISKAEAVSALQNMERGDDGFELGREEGIDALQGVPAANVAPVEPAHWILLPEEDYGTADKECSHCHEWSLIMSHYCHNCGAHMTGATDD